MFDFLFGWRKASKCKKLIKRLQCRLKLLKNKRHAIVRQLREDVAELIKCGYEDSALNRVEQLIIDESILTVYELLDHFCEFILVHFSYIRRHRDCPNDIGEAVSSLIYSSARFGDLPELPVIRELFGEHYGQKFVVTAVELLPGNLVNFQIKEKLALKSIPDDLKYRVVDEIARNYCLHPEILALEYYPGLQELKAKEDLESKVNPSNKDEKGREWTYAGLPTQHLLTDVSAGSPFIQQSQSDSLIPSEAAEDAANLDRVKSSYNFTVYALREKEENVAPSCAESVDCFRKGTVVCLEDIEEVQAMVSKEGGLQDQRIFKFISPASPADIQRELLLAKCCCCKFWCLQPDGETELIAFPQKLNGRNDERGDVIHNVFTGEECKQSEKQNKKTEEEITSCIVSSVPFDGTSPKARNERQAPYLRATTIPPERPKVSRKKNMSRTNSCPVQCPSHVHPKLPEYDDIAAKFTTLKKAHQQCNQQPIRSENT